MYDDIRRARARISRQWDEDLSRRDVVGLMNKFRAKLLNRLSSARLYLYGIPVTGRVDVVHRMKYGRTSCSKWSRPATFNAQVFRETRRT